MFVSCSSRTDVGELDETSGPVNNNNENNVNNANKNNSNMKKGRIKPSKGVNDLWKKCQRDPSMKRILGLPESRGNYVT